MLSDGSRKWGVFLFNLSSHGYIYIVKYLFTSRDDEFANLGETTVLAREMFTSCFRPWLNNVACLSSLISIGRTAIAPAKCKSRSRSRDLARVSFRMIYLVADQSKSLWSSGPI